MWHVCGTVRRRSWVSTSVAGALLDRLRLLFMASLAASAHVRYNRTVIVPCVWMVQWHLEAEQELQGLPPAERVALLRAVQKLEVLGPRLPFPHQSGSGQGEDCGSCVRVEAEAPGGPCTSAARTPSPLWPFRPRPRSTSEGSSGQSPLHIGGWESEQDGRAGP
jgi:hypothetical protein